MSSIVALVRRFRRNRRGATAVEFAIVAPIFFALLFAIIEVAMIFFASQLLETAVQDSSRLILTRQAQDASMSQSQFSTEVCNRVKMLLNCGSLHIDVQNYGSDFSTVSITTPIDKDKNFVDNMQYNIGKAGDIIVVRAFYEWPLFVIGLGFDASNLSGGKRLLSATAAFRNEP
ncbi:Flp pilus assembly protein TadG [Rhodopseudomonas thermotolerans]|jgi:Flp pilus assembly protein TadG|uniref:Flp pilus assembly protein TadG n=2 Tax=Rhodopseudomonas TaxID=1073 RepID=A0A336JUU1_9BRAD|nr:MULTISPECIES: TadE family protein [Rhodopseudomonas]RED30583.1 Flp pilus assembly protein TadG [Rhodopseudomonas pentothenatexigens]REF92687.1 Flp pilus assembly protein TadG [Rhodopseudomonas thermotolerans]SSW92116.1 Flp pilus assembly protein TadG [Rhodopseudomonas pentothenatexigens]